MNNLKFSFFLLLISLLFYPLTGTNVYGQNKKSINGTVERIKVYGKGLEGNLEGDSTNRWVSVYLPASYKSNPKKHYPVIYFLHGYTDDDAKFYGFTKHWMNIVPILDSVFAAANVHEMIVVTPNAYTHFQGSMYSNSVTTGNWEDFVSEELVTYMDTHYRTIAKASGRGLAGHSMGGYGTLRIGEKKPNIFSSIYLLSPGSLFSGSNNLRIPITYMKADSIKTFADFEKADFGTKGVFASAAAWSPNPTNPPFYLDLPVKDGVLQPAILAKWDANRLLNTLDQYISNIKKLKAIGFDAGTKDLNIAANIKQLDEFLNKYGITHFFEIYEGNHINRIAQRIENNMLPFFSTNLSFEK